MIVFKDFTSILSLPPSSRPEVLGALREIYDGHWIRTIGTDGGKKLEWSGRVGVIGAVTTEWDRAHAAVSSMGDRFALLRMQTDALAIGERAIANTGKETVMREELAAAAKAVLDNIDTTPTELTDVERKAARRNSQANVNGDKQIDVGHPAGFDHGACAASTFLCGLEENEKLPRCVPEKRQEDSRHAKSYRDMAVMAACMHHRGRGGCKTFRRRPMTGTRFVDGQRIDVDA